MVRYHLHHLDRDGGGVWWWDTIDTIYTRIGEVKVGVERNLHHLHHLHWDGDGMGVVVGYHYYDGLAGQPSDIRWLRGPHTSYFSKLPGFRYLFRIFQQQMFLANNMIHQPLKARLELALPCYVKCRHSSIFS